MILLETQSQVYSWMIKRNRKISWNRTKQFATLKALIAQSKLHTLILSRKKQNNLQNNLKASSQCLPNICYQANCSRLAKSLKRRLEKNRKR